MNILDIINVVLNSIIVIFTILLARLGIAVGKLTGNLRWWTSFTVGWLIIAVSNTLIALSYTDFVPYNFRSFSVLLVIAAFILIYYGMRHFCLIIIKEGKE